MALPPLELPPIEKGSPCCRAALLPLTHMDSKEGDSFHLRRGERRGRTSFVAEDVTAEIRGSRSRGTSQVENRRHVEPVPTQKVTSPEWIAHADRSVVDSPSDDAELALVASAGHMERDEMQSRASFELSSAAFGVFLLCR